MTVGNKPNGFFTGSRTVAVSTLIVFSSGERDLRAGAPKPLAARFPLQEARRSDGDAAIASMRVGSSRLEREDGGEGERARGRSSDARSRRCDCAFGKAAGASASD